MSPLYEGNPVSVVLTFLFVLGLLFLTLYLIKKYGGVINNSEQDNIKILETKNVGPRHKVLIIEIKQQRLLLGVTPTEISLLTVLEADSSLEFEQKNNN